MAPRPVVVDFETEGIEQRPAYPPRPVGVALAYPGKAPKYLAWGHPTANNTTFEKAKAELAALWKSGQPLLFHNAKFDLEVAEKHMGLALPPWELVHDTLYLIFLNDPHSRTLSLKPTSEALLGLPPEEQDAVHEWLIKAGIVRRNQKDWGAFISKAPGDLVGRYAIGDVLRTDKLFQLLYDVNGQRGLLKAYDRERELMPILLKNEQEGIRVNEDRLGRDIKTYEAAKEKADAWLRKRLKVPGLNVDADQDLANALESSGVVTEWEYTEPSKTHPQGVKRVAKDSLIVERFHDPEVARVLGYRNRLQTCMSTFMYPWAELAGKNSGYIFTRWNQVRNEQGGARTGRMSCSPNFQNIPKNWYDKGDGYEHPTKLDVPELPFMRVYLLPDKGELFGHRDYNQQELRILAHWEDDQLCKAYNDDPELDIHTFVQTRINELTGLGAERREVKVLNFGMVYGMGLAKLAAAIKRDMQTAGAIKKAQRRAIPGLQSLENAVKFAGAVGDEIRTWGGRLYAVEPPMFIHGRLRTFEYKLLNYLIQGSAADCTKQAIINYAKLRKDGRFLVTVHDEINISVAKKAAAAELGRLREAMESVKFDVPMLSDAKLGPSWGELKKFKEAA